MRKKVIEITKVTVTRAESSQLVIISAILRNYHNTLLILLPFRNEIKIQEEIK